MSGKEVVVVEIKTTLSSGDEKYFINKLKEFREWIQK
jgi:hypothetical protein